MFKLLQRLAIHESTARYDLGLKSGARGIKLFSIFVFPKHAQVQDALSRWGTTGRHRCACVSRGVPRSEGQHDNTHTRT